MAWSEIKGVQIQEPVKNYAGYLLCYGEMTLSDIIAKQYIPLTVRGSVGLRAHFGGSIGFTSTVRSTTGGNKTLCNYSCGTELTVQVSKDASAGFTVDLECLYNSNLTHLKSINSFTTSAYEVRSQSYTIIKWLVPIEE